MYSVTFYNRNFTSRVQPVLKLSVDRLVWSSEGGPSLAQFSALLDDRDALGLVDYLRCPVEVWNGQGRLVWWGYLESIEFSGIKFDLASMANQVQAMYTFSIDEGTSIITQKLYTSWSNVLNSQADFGVKQRILEAGAVTLEQATSQRDQAITIHGHPQPAMSPKSPNPTPGVVLVCHGWYETLDWLYYTNLAGLETYTVSGVGVQAVGDLAAETKLAQSMQAAVSGWDLGCIWLKACKAGAPGDNLVVSVYADTGGVPSGSVLASGILAGSSLSVDYGWVHVAFSPVITLGVGVYWFVITRSGGLDAVNFYKFKVNEACGYPRGIAKLWNGSAWVARVPDADVNFTALGIMDTAWQIGAITSACSQFLSGWVIHFPSGILATQYRDGLKTGLQEIKSILASGTIYSDGLVALVNQSRVLHVFSKSTGNQLVMGEDGVIRNAYGQVVPEEEIVAQWLKIERPGLSLSDTQFITQVEVDAEGKISLEW
jgi:hypothetical protein